MRKISVLLPFFLLFTNVSIKAQVKSSSDFCEIFTDFFNGKETIDFMHKDKRVFRDFDAKGDSVIVIYDPDSILKKCFITHWDNRKLEIITTGEIIDRIRNESIFITIEDNRNHFLVTMNKSYTKKGLKSYRIFHPLTGATKHFVLKKKRKIYYVVDQGYGYF